MPGPRAFSVALCLLTVTPIFGADVDYLRDIKPLLTEKCAACHGALRQEAGLRLDAAVLVHQGGDSGAVIVAGDSISSLLIERVTTSDTDLQMPPEGEGERLQPHQVQLLQTWIESGAHAPADESIPSDPDQHWAYQRPKQTAIAGLVQDDESFNPIDAFIFAQHRRSGLTAAAKADPTTLVRRVYLDLIGLPPTPEQIDDFLRDPSPVAYQNLVDQLLASPQYGERWARHWMDVWRYSDWAGYKQQLRESQRHIWRWRDWIVDSLNEGKGYDRMIVEMLAGDEVAPENLDVVRATGFLARNFHKSNRNIWLDATVEHTSKAFLAVTMNCARCHDHKFDPISQMEYYAMRAIFEPHHVRTERLPGHRDTQKDGVARVFDADPNAKTFLYERGNEKHFDKDSPVAANLPSLFGQSWAPQPITLPPVAVFPALSAHVEADEISHAEVQLATASSALVRAEKKTKDQTAGEVKLARLKVRSLKAALASLRARWAADRAKYSRDADADLESLAQQAAQAEREADVVKARLDRAVAVQQLSKVQLSEATDEKKQQASIEKANKEVAAANKRLTEAEQALSSTDAKYTSVGKAYPEHSTGRRLALANWIANEENPLTARVAVNHIWLRHFGEPLVANTFDFGLRSPRPQLADLLDWLAVELMANEWDLKHIHRLIVRSRTYQASSTASPGLATANANLDPDNRLFWKANVRRLDAEVIRDSLLHAAGSLDTQLHGEDIDYAEGETVARRSLYFRHAYEKQMTMLVLFDAAGPNECYRRSESVIPQQALTLANSSLSVSQSRRLANQLWKEIANEPCSANDDLQSRFIRSAFRRTLSRTPSAEEVAACRRFLQQQSSLLASPDSLTEFASKSSASVAAAKDPDLRAMQNLVHVLMNHNDFVSVR